MWSRASALLVVLMAASSFARPAGGREGIGPRAASSDGFSFGFWTWVVSDAGAVLTASDVKNSNSTASGPLRLSLWMTLTPFPAADFNVASYNITDSLGAGQSIAEVNSGKTSVPYTRPPTGCYYVTLALEEQSSGTWITRAHKSSLRGLDVHGGCITSFAAAPPETFLFGLSALSWTTGSAIVSGVTIDNGVGSQPANGSTRVRPRATTTYTLTAMNLANFVAPTRTVDVVVKDCVQFSPRTSYAAGPSPAFVAAGDLNGDRVPDLVATNYDFLNLNGSISILLGSGAATFAPAITRTVGYRPYGVAIGDFNADGDNDLAVANEGEGSISILLGNGSGTNFEPPPNFPIPIVLPFKQPISLLTADFNADRILDLVLAGIESPALTSNVSILLGRGDGRFRTPAALTTGFTPASADGRVTTLAIADFNGDRKPDLAVGGNSTAVSILLGNGDGSFQTPMIFPTQLTSALRIATGDFDEDGHTDLALAGQSGLAISPGRGDGTFATPSILAGTGPLVLPVAIADLNRDGLLDLIEINYDSFVSFKSVAVLLGKGDNSFASPVLLNGGSAPHWIAVADLDGDGMLDLALANDDEVTPSNDSVSVLLNSCPNPSRRHAVRH